eukprot:2781940-Alexandrium_andersonii.AAC.1
MCIRDRALRSLALVRTWARQSERPSCCRGGREVAPWVRLVARVRASLATLCRWLGLGHLGD